MRDRLCWFICGVLLLAPQVRAQFPPGLFGPQDDGLNETTESLHARKLPSDPLMEATFGNATRMIGNDNMTEGLEAMQSILDQSGDVFLVANPRLDGSLKTSVLQELNKHQKDYEQLYGTTAQQLVDEAIESSDENLLRDVVRRFRLTQAGSQAVQSLAMLLQDRGDFGGAARLLVAQAEFAKGADQANHAAQAIVAFKNAGQQALAAQLVDRFSNVLTEHGEMALVTAAEPAAIEEGSAFNWWTVFGTLNQSSSADSAPAILEAAWRVSDLDMFDITTMLPTDRDEKLLEDALDFEDSVERQIRDSSNVAFPAAVPLIAGNHVIMRGNGTLKEFEVATGKLVGVSDVYRDKTFQELNKDSYSPNDENNLGREEMRELFFSMRDWRDLTSSSISTDGRHAYILTDCQLVGSTPASVLMRNTIEHPLIPQRRNLLHACDLSSGLMTLWMRGHGQNQAQFAEQRVAQDIYFYSAPLPVDGRLYVIGEERGQVQLFELDPATGLPLWSVGLLNPEEDLVLSNARRMAGLMPTYHAGLLYCPTGEGVVSAVDPVMQQVVWSTPYTEVKRTRISPFRQGRPSNQSVKETITEELRDNRWLDCRLLAVGGRLLMTSHDSRDLIAFDSESGEVLWRRENAAEHMMYMAGAYNDTFILVGRHDIRCLSAQDGEMVWSAVVPIPPPSGRGIIMQDRFLQPVKTGEIAVIDLQAGQLRVLSPLPSGVIPGNLVVGQGRLLMQTGTELIAFHTMGEIEATIAASPESASSLALQGELALQRGETQQGLELLRSAMSKQPSPRLNKVYLSAVLEGLRFSYDDYKGLIPEVEALLTAEDQKLSFQKRIAQSLHDSGKIGPAVERYLKILALPESQTESMHVDSFRSMTYESWALGQLKSLMSDEQVQASVATWLDTASTEQFLDALRFLPSSMLQPKLLDRLAQISSQTEHPLLVRSVLLRLAEQPEHHALAVRLLTDQTLALKQGDSAKQYLNLIERDLAKVQLTEERTGAQFVNQIQHANEWRETLLADPDWPADVKVVDPPGAVTPRARFPLQIVGPSSVELNGWNFLVDEMGQHIEIYDAHGRRTGRISTGLNVSIRGPALGPYVGRYASTHGKLALIVMTNQFMVVDLSKPSEPRVITTQRLISDPDDRSRMRGFISYRQRPQPGFRTSVSTTSDGNWAGNVGPLNSSLLCYSFETELIALDPTTGQERWRRRDLVPGSEILGDDHYVLVLPPDENTFSIYRIEDGELIGKRAAPNRTLPSSVARRGADWGRYLPLFDPEESDKWELYDPVTDKNVWERELPSNTKWAPVGGQDVAFLTHDDQCIICDGLTGQEKLVLELPEVDSNRFDVIEYPDQWIIVYGDYADQQYSVRNLDLPEENLTSPVTGLALAVDRKSKEILWQNELRDLSVPAQLPPRWPIVYFYNNRGQDMEVLIINRKTGAKLVENASNNDGRPITWYAETQPLKIHFRFSRFAVELECTEPLD